MECVADNLQHLPPRRRGRGRRGRHKKHDTTQIPENASFVADTVTGMPATCSNAAPYTNRQLRNLVYELRHLSQALRRTCAPLRNSMFRAVRSFLQSRLTAGASRMPSLRQTIRLVGLGIGCFHPREHRAGFVQMAALLALRDVCNEEADKANAQCAKGCMDSNYAGRARVHTTFFDPVVEPLHMACCAALDIEVEQVNRHGAYTLDEHDTALILYMPHCPWALLHNAVAANWPRNECTTTGHTCADAFERLFFVANDPRDALLCDSKHGLNALRADLLACWLIEALNFDKRANPGNTVGAFTLQDDGDSSVSRSRTQEFSHAMYCTHELRRAFAYMAAFGADTKLESNLLHKRLHALARTPPAIINPRTTRGVRPIYSELL